MSPWRRDGPSAAPARTRRPQRNETIGWARGSTAASGFGQRQGGSVQGAILGRDAGGPEIVENEDAQRTGRRPTFVGLDDLPDQVGDHLALGCRDRLEPLQIAQ